MSASEVQEGAAAAQEEVATKEVPKETVQEVTNELEKEDAASSPATETKDNHRPASLAPSTALSDTDDKDTDTFEDAIDTGSLRSLTKRSSSFNRPRSPSMHDSAAADSDHDAVSHTTETPQVPKTTENKEEEQEEVFETPAAEQENKSLHRISHASKASEASAFSAASLDDVSLNDNSTIGDTEKTLDTAPSSTKKMSISSVASALPAMPWSPSATEEVKSPPIAAPVAAAAPPPPAPAALTPAPPPPVTRKLTSPFSWLSRSSSKEVNNPPPPAPAATGTRRNTASSVATLSSNPEGTLGKLDEEGGNKNTLKDRFKQLRLREEGSAPTGDEDEKSSTSEEKEAVQPPPSPLPPTPNPALAPGTASGVTAGPSAGSDAPVDWDLWQTVVYEGPAAVARTSPEQLKEAIAKGIPSAIRGVIWQVLAQSKNEELETVYRDLVARGTDKERKSDRQSNASISLSNGKASGKDTPSSASSVHSEKSGPNGTGAPSPTEKDSEAFVKAQALAAAERKKKEKEDKEMLSRLEKVIRRDLGARTSYSKFAAAQGLQEGLFGVCKAYALFDEGVGYAQGMNFLVMPLLFNMPEEEAFCLLVRLMNQYHLRELFIQDMPGLHKCLYQFERLLEDLEPALYCHLHRRGISPHLYATQWFLTLFAYRFPLQLVLRIYDLIFSEGLSAIIKFGIVLMQKNATALLGMSDMSQLTTFLKDRLFDVYIDATPSSNSILENGFFGSSSASIDKEVYRADQLVRDACDVKITAELLKEYGKEWEDKTKAEKEREQELEGLKQANTNYAVMVRRLEERIEAVDREQASLATELVRTKVENEELKDENESLKGQVKELRVVIEHQPEELENKWSLERDDLMKRNEKVHEENQKLEKELADLEEQLVQTKLQYAEINSAHETLTRKWADLKRQVQAA
ncbi:rab-GTPase-TBC domain-containing protein [Pseudoneurospora amorphoporcata]|uniref:GTPase-activating protein GYP5 n=1 Tax=Pseudoneurospora amorphoporcata TaxID=241081 RepID=A0AAN6NYE9_9PEZI|nr:rab-GTPase-TBC domain-containing protein [Pseudoneurospora amorphoporcata]